MRGSAVFRTGIAPGGALAGPWVQNSLWTAARAVPSLDLRFADNKSLVDAVTGAQLVTFTRASSGTFVGSDGLLRTAVTNLVLRSEEFGTTWTATRSSVTANTITAPNGTLTADAIIEDTTVTNTHNIGQSISFISGTTYTVSVFAKATTSPRFLQIIFPSVAFGATRRPVFDLVNGTALASTDTTASIENIGDGWYRCITSMVATSTTSTPIQLQLANTYTVGAGSSVYTGDGVSGLYLWGAQLEQSSTVGEYIPTTSTINSAPRFDHNPTTGESLGLLVEEARTNLLLQSQDFTTSWSQTNVTTTPNTTISPDGSTNADTLAINVIAASTSQTTQTFTAGSTITVSVFAKKNTSNFVRFELGSLCSCWFNLDTGVTATNNAGSGTILFSAKSIQSYGNGWYRCVLTVTTSVITALGVSIFATNSDGTTSSIGSSVFLWGAEAEVGAFATSYIPTTTATVTRAADVASITGANFSSWYNQTEGTVFADNTNYGVSNTRIVSFSDNSQSNRFTVARGTGLSGNINTTVTVSGVAQVNSLVLASSLSFGSAAKAAVAIKASDFAGSVNGLAPVTQATGSIPTTFSQITIGNGEVLGANTFSGTLKRLVYWGQRLPNNVLQAITQ